MVHFGPFSPDFGPFWSANRTLAIPEQSSKLFWAFPIYLDKGPALYFLYHKQSEQESIVQF